MFTKAAILARVLLILGLVGAVLVPAAAGAQVPAASKAPGAKTAKDLTLELLTEDTTDPTAISVTPDGRVVFAERQGAVKVITSKGTLVTAGTIPVNATACFNCADNTLEEGGLHGLEVSPKFAKNQLVYAYYSVPFSVATSGFGPAEAEFRLSTFKLSKSNKLDLASEKVLLRNPAGTLACCHYGGDIDFLKDGTLTLTVGDDTSPRVEGFNPRDERPGFHEYNAERTSQNKKDRRGKVLRLLPNGGVPNGKQEGIRANPFVGNAKYDPYIYAMGFRSNYRSAHDPKTGSVFVGNVGPDAAADDPNRGPRGYDELETVRRGGGSNHGWPRCIGNNIPYRDYDYTTQTSGAPLSCKGMTPAQVWYPYGKSGRFPKLGSDGGRTAIGGVVYRYGGSGRYELPDRYKGTLLFMEWSRNKIFTMPIIDGRRADGRPVKGYGKVRPSEMRLIGSGLLHPVDAAIGPDGAIYIAEYGNGFYMNRDSRITRLVPKSASKVAAASTAAATTTANAGVGVPLPLAAPVGLAVLALIGNRRRRTTVA